MKLLNPSVDDQLEQIAQFASQDPGSSSQPDEASPTGERVILEEVSLQDIPELAQHMDQLRAAKPPVVGRAMAQVNVSPGDVVSRLDTFLRRANTLDYQRALSQYPELQPLPQDIRSDHRMLWGRSLRKIAAGWQLCLEGIQDLTTLVEGGPDEELGFLVGSMVSGAQILDPEGVQPPMSVRPPAPLEVADPRVEAQPGPIGTPEYAESQRPIAQTKIGEEQRRSVQQMGCIPDVLPKIAAASSTTPAAADDDTPVPVSRIVAGQRHYLCSECGVESKSYPSKDACRSHIRQAHLPDQVKWQCELCDHSFESWHGFQRHAKGKHQVAVRKVKGGVGGFAYTSTSLATPEPTPRTPRRSTRTASTSAAGSSEGSPETPARKRPKRD